LEKKTRGSYDREKKSYQKEGGIRGEEQGLSSVQLVLRSKEMLGFCYDRRKR